MKSISTRRQFAALTLALILALILATTPAWSVEATFSGRVFDADGVTPQSGVTVSLIEGPGETIYSSEATGTSGTFLIDSAPVGSYSVLVDTAEGAYQYPVPLELHEGANKPLALSLNASQTGLGGGGGLDGWPKWVILGVLIFSGLCVAAEVVDGSSSGSFEGAVTLFTADDLDDSEN